MHIGMSRIRVRAYYASTDEIVVEPETLYEGAFEDFELLDNLYHSLDKTKHQGLVVQLIDFGVAYLMNDYHFPEELSFEEFDPGMIEERFADDLVADDAEPEAPMSDEVSEK